MLSDNSANAGSKASMGVSELPPLALLRDSRREDREEGRRGVVGREIGRWVEVERFWVLLVGRGVVEDMLGGLRGTGGLQREMVVGRVISIEAGVDAVLCRERAE